MENHRIRTVFLGSNWEALATLKVLSTDDRFEMVGVVTMPDKPVGRKMQMTANEVKLYAQSKEIPVFHTEKLEERYREVLEKTKPELVVCKSFGEIVPSFFLEEPKYKAINIHYSVLPEYRGAIPIQKAILDGKSSTGFTIVKMVEKMDAGPILKTYEEPIYPDDTNQTLRERLVQKSTEVIADVLIDWTNGKIETHDQDESLASFCWQKEISKENAMIDCTSQSPEYIERMVRAMLPWPVAWMNFRDQRLKIFRVQLINGVAEKTKNKTAGEVYKMDKQPVLVSSNPDILVALDEVQLEGKNRITGEQFANGQNLESI